MTWLSDPAKDFPPLATEASRANVWRGTDTTIANEEWNELLQKIPKKYMQAANTG